MPDGNFKERYLSKVSHFIVKLPKKKGVDNIYYPGENKKNIKDKNIKTGIIVDTKILEELDKTAKEIGLTITI